MEIPATVVGLALMGAGFFVGHYLTMIQVGNRHVMHVRAAHARGMQVASMISTCAYELMRSAMTESQFIVAMNAVSMTKFKTMLPLATQEDANAVNENRGPGQEGPQG